MKFVKPVLALVGASVLLAPSILASLSAKQAEADNSREVQKGWRWSCVESGCGAGGSATTRDAANTAAKDHERANKGHRWDLKETN